MANVSLSEGQVLDGKYVIQRRIAEGGMSTVYLGTHARIGKNVAVKVLHAGVAKDPILVERFEREARIASRVHSPHVADVYDFGELADGERYMVMEYLDGESLAACLARVRTLASEELARIAIQILDALSVAHAAGVVHRDLKPENVLLSRRGRDGKDIFVKLLDFGISRLNDARSTDPRITIAGAVLGTPLYMSPEQARGSTEQIDERTDLFSLGVMLYEASAGEPPLVGENVNALLFRVALDAPTPLLKKAPSVDPRFAEIVHKAMSKSPAERYQSADEMRDALEAWQASSAPAKRDVTRARTPSASEESMVAVVPLSTIPPPTSRSILPDGTPTVASSLEEPKPFSFGRFRHVAMLMMVVALFVVPSQMTRRALRGRHAGPASESSSGVPHASELPPVPDRHTTEDEVEGDASDRDAAVTSLDGHTPTP